jgi:biofilm PGA synthesis N-glycosyltransferase PgaC
VKIASPAQTVVIVTPVRDEAGYITHTLRSVERQTCRPAQWVIVDDGSTDGTGAVLDRYAARHPWVCVVHRANRGFRLNGGGVMEAFYAGYDHVSVDAWDFLMKLDGDLSFEPEYLEKCLDHFANDPKLGIGGGTICSVVDGELKVESSGDPPFHVRGATKIYRRDCWDQIAPLAKAPGWDTLDEVRANYLGWQTRTFPELKLVQYKPTGSADGSWKNAFKNGKANYLTGYHPAFMLAKCSKRLLRRPYLVEGIGLCAGFMSGYLKRLPQLASADTIRYLRQQQIRRLTLRRSIYG